MGGNNKDLTHEEIWDDSALIESWNEALAEYKKYHSIHAKGGSVRDLEPKSKTLENAGKSGDAIPDVESTEEGALDETNSTAGQNGPSVQVPKGGLGSFPIQAVLGSVQDETLKKLLMSWYYAGYYTGLFEGQQQAQQSRDS